MPQLPDVTDAEPVPDIPTSPDIVPDAPLPPDTLPDLKPDLPAPADVALEVIPDLFVDIDGAADLQTMADAHPDAVDSCDNAGELADLPNLSDTLYVDLPIFPDAFDLADEQAGDVPESFDVADTTADVPLPECYGDGDCSPCFPCILQTGMCALEPAPDGTPCDDLLPTTFNDQCQTGSCLCVADCTGRVCGDDGCGGACGQLCPSGYECDVLGQCQWSGWVCGSTECPYLANDDDNLPDYSVRCNAQEHCEYTYAGLDNASWRQWDVWIWVPPGTFEMGGPAEEGGPSDERPVHTVQFANGYFIAKYEAVVEQYEACEADGGSCTAPSTADWSGGGWGLNRSTNGRHDHPQNGLTWLQANQFCAWQGGRLPNEAEWEYAETGPMHRKYPWGDAPEPDCDHAIFNGCNGTQPVGSPQAGSSHVGALDMAGSVWEWCEDWWHNDYDLNNDGNVQDGPPDDAPVNGSAWVEPSSSYRVRRGGDFSSESDWCRTARRNNEAPSSRSAINGARCVRDFFPIGMYCPKASCPDLPDYSVACNARGHRERTYAGPDSASWRQWDVWIWVPPGTFEMGAPEEEEWSGVDERPVYTVQFLSGYFIAKYEIVVEQYEACQTDASACSAPSTADWDGAGWGTNRSNNVRVDHPQNGITWLQANQFCAWRGGRLPSEAEWEYAASGPVHRTYPWGDVPVPDCYHVVFNHDNSPARPWGCDDCETTGCSGTQPVGVDRRSAGASFVGAHDMAGNVWEWCEDVYHEDYDEAPADGRAWVDPGGIQRVLRGGTFTADAKYMRSTLRGTGSTSPAYFHATYGARCVRDYSPINLYCPKASCPDLPGYTAACNARGHCEYTRNEQTESWHQWDVWIWVPPGAFEMGAPEGETGSQVGERPVHSVQFAQGYFIAKYEVVVEQYEACEAGSSCTAPSTADWDGEGWGLNRSANGRGNHPQNGLNWLQANQFCAWSGGRLSSEAEWEYAASGPIHRKYPWGDAPEPDCEHAVFDNTPPTNERPWGCDACPEAGCSGTQSVGTRAVGASYAGALDMAGNVWEWCEDWAHDLYADAPVDGSAWLDPIGPYRVFRGGGFHYGTLNLRSASRDADIPTRRRAHLGARCARDLEP